MFLKVMKPKHSKCLLLNADYTPLSIIDWKRAIVWDVKYANNIKYAIEIIDFYKDDFIQCSNKKIPVPAVARTKRYFNINHQHKVTFSRKNLFIRDDYTCQYCGVKFHMNELTYDHVIPKSCWKKNSSPTNWTNIVTSCVVCNRKKGNKTPKEANMPLITTPIAPNRSMKYLPVQEFLLMIRSDIPLEWSQYMKVSYI